MRGRAKKLAEMLEVVRNQVSSNSSFCSPLHFLLSNFTLFFLHLIKMSLIFSFTNTQGDVMMDYRFGFRAGLFGKAYNTQINFLNTLIFATPDCLDFQIFWLKNFLVEITFWLKINFSFPL